MDIKLKNKDWKKQKKVVNKIGIDFSKIVKDSLEKTILDMVRYAKEEQFPNSFRNITGNLRLSIGATKDLEVKKMKRKGKSVVMDGMQFLNKAMSGDSRVKKVGNKFIGKFIVAMEYASYIENKYGFAVRAMMIKRDEFEKHLKKDIKNYKNKNRIR